MTYTTKHCKYSSILGIYMCMKPHTMWRDALPIMAKKRTFDNLIDICSKSSGTDVGGVLTFLSIEIEQNQFFLE